MILKTKDLKLRNLTIIWLVMFLILFLSNITMFPFSLFRKAALVYPRAEDTGRYILGVVPLMAILAGLFISDAVDKLRTVKYGIVIAVIFLIFVAYMTYGQYAQKLEISYNIKHFPQSWFDACDWIKRNTPSNTTVYGVYGAQISIICDRNVGRAYPDNAEIQILGNDTVYEHLKLHGFEYVYIPVNQISSTPYDETYYVKFYQYVATSTKFKLVFDDTSTYSNNGVQIFEVL